MAGARVALALCALLLLVDGVARRAEAASYTVGNSAGWDLSADLPSWANGKTFYVGDVLGTIENLASIPCPARPSTCCSSESVSSAAVRSETKTQSTSLIATRFCLLTVCSFP